MSGFQLTEGQRAAAIERAGESLALLSGAGCGKTFVLSLRFLQRLKQLDQPEALGALVALTYTRKAALEMSQRVRHMLARELAEAPEDQRRRLRLWLDQMGEARIGTIHSFCAALLRRHAIAAGLDPAFTVGEDDIQASRMRSESAEEALLDAVEAQDAGTMELLGSVSFAQATTYVQQLIANRNRVDLEVLSDKQRILRLWREQLEQAAAQASDEMRNNRRLREQLAYLQGYPLPGAQDKLAIAVAENTHVAGQLLAGHLEPEIFDALYTVRKNTGRLDAWGSKETRAEIAEHLNDLVQALKAYRDWFEQINVGDQRDAGMLATLGSLAHKADQLYTRRKRRAGILDFDDLLGRTRRLLTDRPDIREQLAQGISQLFIDECQDTDAMQLGLLMDLLGPAEETFENGKLFVVGDPKQSIYRFRGAQVEVFEDLCERFGRPRREVLDLSFRTHQPGVELVNHVFSGLMGDDYAPLRAHHRPDPEHPTAEIQLARGPGGAPPQNADEAIGLQADLAAQRIAEMVHQQQRVVRDASSGQLRPARWADFAILLTRMTHVHRFERALAQRGVPTLVVAGAGFFNQQEVTDVLNALRAIDNPLDDLALVGLLRSAMFALDDNAMAHLAEATRPPYFPALGRRDVRDELASRLDRRSRRRLSEATDLLARLSRIKDAVGIDTLIREVLDATGYEAVLLSDFQGRQKLGNVRRLIEMAASAGTQGVSLAGFIDQVQDMIIVAARQEQAPVAGEQDDVVRIMTVHKAKGLEFPIVVLPDLNSAAQGRSSRLLFGTGWQAAINTAEDDEAPIGAAWRVASLQDADDQHREDLRLLYVAMTRHEDYLLFIGADWRTRDGRFRSKGSWLDLLDEPLGLADAVDANLESVRYGGNRELIVGCRTPAGPPRRQGRKSKGARLLESAADCEQLGKSLAEGGDQASPPPLLGPIPAETGRIELAVTALSDYLLCPRLYYLRHELRLPGQAVFGPGGGQTRPEVDPLVLGTVLHRCMELLNFDAPQSPGQLLRRVRGELDLGPEWANEPIETLLAEAIENITGSQLASDIREARGVHRELDFITTAGPAELRGQIDLLYADAEGRWHIVDYKSDRLGPDEDPAKHAQRYELQMLLYAVACGRFLEVDPPPATLYFLRSGDSASLEWSPDQARRRMEGVEQTALEMIRRRREGQFPAEVADGSCRGCPYRSTCGR